MQPTQTTFAQLLELIADPKLCARVSRAVHIDAADCWRWQGGTALRGGYKQVRSGGRKKSLAHRLVWSIVYGPVPDEAFLDHLCRVTECCNPSHMEPVTAQENAQRRSDAQRRKLDALYEELTYWKRRALAAEGLGV